MDGNEYLIKKYMNIFKEWRLNDIRILQLNKIYIPGLIINELDANKFVVGVSRFQSECKLFMEWLQSLDIGGIDIILSGHGILTFNALFYYAKNERDLISIIGKKYQYKAIILWNSIPKY